LKAAKRTTPVISNLGKAAGAFADVGDDDGE